MVDYKVGEYYNFQVKGISKNRLHLEDEDKDRFSVRAYDFQTEWDWSSPQVPEQMVRCYVKAIDEHGYMLLEQSSDTLLALLYPEAYARVKTVCVFTVKELKTIGNDLFFILIDAFGLTHIYKPSARYQSLQPGDEIELYVKCIEEKAYNKSRLIFEEIEVQAAPVSGPVVAAADDSDAPVGEFGEETDKIEFKSTIIYPAGATSPDIDTQMRIILRTIAGFMNAQGGTLYIGVNNNGDAVGIEQDYPLLNSSIKDKYTYLEDKDGYENKKMYVWIDAVLGYLTNTMKLCEENGLNWEEFWKKFTESGWIFFFRKW